MAGSIEELLDLLYTEIEEAKNAPLSNDRCVIERDRVLDMIDDVKAELPVEIKRAKDLVANKNDYVASAKREADDLRHQAEDYAKRLVNEDAIVREAREAGRRNPCRGGGAVPHAAGCRQRVLRGHPPPHGGGCGRRL